MKKIDITGMRFGQLTVLSEAQRKGYWICRCDCGNEKEIYGQNLRNGYTKTCGCSKGEIINSNLTGQRFGILTVQHEAERKGYWICRCDCGKTTEVSVYKLIEGHTKSCGCIKINDLTGKRFGRLTVLRKSQRKSSGQYYWVCQCDCGKIKEIIHSSLTQGTALSCGCLLRESVSKKQQEFAALKTNPDRIRHSSKLQKNNTSGTTGVTYNKKTGIYTARISFKGIRYTLKRSHDINVCIAARKEAEEALFGNFLEWYDSTVASSRISNERAAFLKDKEYQKNDKE